jgi:hypothetical protein
MDGSDGEIFAIDSEIKGVVEDTTDGNGRLVVDGFGVVGD